MVEADPGLGLGRLTGYENHAGVTRLGPGAQPLGRVVLIGATNQPNALDPALRRPGRFDREIALRVPDVRGRTEILQIHSRDAALAGDVDFARLAQLTPGFVGADLEALCREAAMNALRRVLPHPIFGSWDGYQWILATAAHTARHLRQIREIQSAEAFPKCPAGVPA